MEGDGYAFPATSVHMLYRIPFFIACSWLLAACSGEDPAPEVPAGPCAGSTVTPDAFVAGLTKSGSNGRIGASILDALPAPPGPGSNAWKVQLLDESGEPLPGATITKVRPWMPDHSHGSGVPPKVTMQSDGSGAIDALEFVMPGVWTVTITSEKDAQSDDATFAFCIDG